MSASAGECLSQSCPTKKAFHPTTSKYKADIHTAQSHDDRHVTQPHVMLPVCYYYLFAVIEGEEEKEEQGQEEEEEGQEEEEHQGVCAICEGCIM